MEITIVIGVVGTLFGMLIGYFTFTRNRDKDVKSDAAEQAVVRTKLDSIGRGIDSMRIDFKVHETNTRSSITQLTEKVIRVEESAKQAHKRIDGIGER